MKEFKEMRDCLLCKRSFQFGPDTYDGKLIKAWGIMVCNACYRGNWDGIVPARYPHLMAHLKSEGITVTPNAKGWIDWPQ